MDNFFGSMNLQGNYGLDILFALLSIWSFAWKGLALWHAAKNKQQYWFIVMLLPIGTLGLLEIVYLFRFATKRLTIKELRSLIKKG